MKILDFSYVALDLETTGLSLTEDRPVSIAAVYYRPASQEKRIVMNMLCDPCKDIPKVVIDLHGITNDMVKGSPDYLSALHTLKLLLEDIRPDYLVGYNSNQYDIPMIENHLQSNLCIGADRVDVLDIAYRYCPEFTSHKLSAVYKAVTGSKPLVSHGALQDVLSTFEIFELLAKKEFKNRFNDQSWVNTMAHLAQDIQIPQPYKVLPIGKFKGSKLSSIPKGWAVHMKNTAKTMRPDLKATVQWVLEYN